MNLEPLEGEESLPKLKCFFIAAGRHDRDRIEIQFGFEGLANDSARDKFSYNIDFMLFVPKSLGLLEVDHLNSLRTEFQSYVRLHSHTSAPDNETGQAQIEERLKNFETHPNTDNIRNFAIDFEGYLKAQTKILKRSLLEILDASKVEKIGNEISSIHLLINKFRDILLKYSHQKEIGNELLLLNEYVSHAYTQHLAGLLSIMPQTAEHEKIRGLLTKNASLEAKERKKYGLVTEGVNPSTESSEVYLRRIGILKKYFHKSLFVQVSGEAADKKLFIPVYGISAAIAALWVILIQIFYTHSLTTRVGINSALVIFVGIFAYVCKDLMKDFFRKYLMHRGSRWFPDYEKKLYLNTPQQRLHLGKILEYLRTFDSEGLAPTLKKLRYSVPGGKLEEFLHEDILHFKKKVNLDLKALSHDSPFPWGLREVVRYRFERFFPAMEDAYKKTYFLTLGGEPMQKLSHRIYHVYLAAWISSDQELADKSLKTAFRAFRVSLDKTGVISCESLDWEKQFGTPDVP